MTTTREEQRDVVRDWLIRKNGYFYRPNRCGYTQEVIAAGLYTEAEARAVALVEPESISAHHISEWAVPVESGCVLEWLVIDRLRSASQAGGVPAGWMDISTAPKDGTYVDIWGVNPAGRRFPGVRWTDWPPVGAVDGFTWRDERGVPVVDHADAVATNWMALPSAPGAPPPATDGALESEGLVQATVQGNGSVTLPVCQWQPIETAPKDGTWVLCLAKRATVPVIASHQFSTGGIGRWIDKDASDFSGHDDPSEAWIEYWNSNSYTPTHWMPLPPRPDDRTNASEAQSGSLNQALPASPVSATDAVKAERACSAKDILLYLRAEASEWKEDVDGDANDSGRMISYVTHHITLADNNLQELLDMAGVKPVWSETCVDALDRINEAEFDAAAIRSRGTDEVGNG